MLQCYRKLIQFEHSLIKSINRSFGFTSCRQDFNDKFEPPYLKQMKLQFPIYEPLTVQIKGFDFPLLENFQKFIHNIAEYMGFKVDNSWALPPQHLKVSRYKPQSTVVDSEYKLLVYERNVIIKEAKAFKLPLLLEVIQTALPEGVKMSVYPLLVEHEKNRYVPNYELQNLRVELDELGGPLNDDNKQK